MTFTLKLQEKVKRDHLSRFIIQQFQTVQEMSPKSLVPVYAHIPLPRRRHCVMDNVAYAEIPHSQHTMCIVGFTLYVHICIQQYPLKINGRIVLELHYSIINGCFRKQLSCQPHKSGITCSSIQDKSSGGVFCNARLEKKNGTDARIGFCK